MLHLTNLYLMKKCFFILILLLAGIFALGQTTTLSGRITKPNGTPLVGFPVQLSGAVNDTTLTDEQGNYRFEVLNNRIYTVKPLSPKDYLNGVDYQDLQMIRRHILARPETPSPFTSAYQYIAADINNSKAISTFDLVSLQKTLKGDVDGFVNNQSWRFIAADYVFPFPNNPWRDTLYQTDTLNVATSPVADINFFGIKMGDVTGDANPNLDKLNFITGKISRDLNGDCIADTTILSLSGVRLRLSNATDTVLTSVGADGRFRFNALNGNYRLELQTHSNLWELCENEDTIRLTGGTEVSLGRTITPTVDCAYLEVDIATNFLRRCFDNVYTVQYCNYGTVLAEAAFVEIQLDTFLTLDSSSIAWSKKEGNRYTFPIGDVALGECGTFNLNVKVACEAVLGQTHCVEATIFPANLCAPPSPAWDGSSLRVEATCAGDSVQFQIKNTGENMRSPSRYWVVEDDLIMMQRTIQLAKNAQQFVKFPANGSTWHLEVVQAEGHPGESHPSRTIEGCGLNRTGTISTGFVNQFSQNDTDPFVAIHCQDNRGAFDPNDKTGFPTGYQSNHFIEKNIALDYLIRFQNTGTDTAFTVFIRDTLSSALDPATLMMGASSHKYTYTLKNNILTFFFDNIMLPDSNVNEPASHGFVKFRIQQRPDNPIGTVIENNAAIYFDFNEPVITNTVWHTIGNIFKGLLSAVENLEPEFKVTVYPNPFVQSVRFALNASADFQGRFKMYNAVGQLVQEQAIIGNVFEMISMALPGGFYSYEILHGNKRLSAGKLILQK